jgi:hypothetical protein
MSAFLPHRDPEQSPDQIPTRLSEQQIAMIEEALACLGEYGEVRLVVERGRLRFIVTQASHDVFKWAPGTIHNGKGI